MRPMLAVSAAWCCLTLTPAVAEAAAPPAAGDKTDGPEVVLAAKVVTGFNTYLGQPVADFGPPLGPIGFVTVAAFNPAGPAPLPLTPDTPDGSLLATFVDPNFIGAIGGDPGAVDPALSNVPLRQVGTNIDLADVDRAPMPAVNQVPLFANAQALPAQPVTLGAWKRARGVLSVRCTDAGTSEVLLVARNLLPNRLYSVFAVYVGPQGFLTPPLGGLPNTFVTDAAGRGTLRRTLNGCPLDPPAPDEPVLLAIDVNFHSDHMLNGIHPSIPFKDGGLAVGAITHLHLEFIINGAPLLAAEGWGSPGCMPSTTTHCLREGRFKVEVSRTDFFGNPGDGKTVGFESDESGLFYFFNRRNWEALVKVLDACPLNGHYWVFAAAASSVEYTLTVTDTASGRAKAYANPLGQVSLPITDTRAFVCP